ncbi:S9 family peptidase [Calidifontibacter indicus]|nr:S9 family peptidase [Calidifontibacter indicus]
MSTPMNNPTIPPRADREPKERVFHGDVFVDDFAWMRDHDDPRLLPLVEAENAYTAARTGHLQEATDTIFAEIRSRVVEDDVSVPVRLGDWWYFSRTSQGAQYEVHVRAPFVADESRPQPQPGVALPGEQVLVDGNAEAEGAEFFELAALEIDRSGTRMAVLVDRTGGERYDLEVRDIATGAVLDAAVTQVGHDLAWSFEGTHLFYGRRDDAWRAHQIWRHELGTPADADVLVLDEPDELFNLGFEASRDDRWLVIHSGSQLTTEAHLLDLTAPTGDLVLVEPRRHGLDYSVEVDDDRILVTHNETHADFELAWAPLATPGRAHWRTVHAPAPGERVLGPVPFAGFVALFMRRGGLATATLLSKTDGDRPYGAPRDIPTASALAVLKPGSNPSYDADAVQLVATSLLTPRTVLDVRPDGSSTVLKTQQVPGFDADRYVEERVWVPGRDGTRLPLDIARRVDVEPDGSNPGYLYGYGSYEVSIDPAFSVLRLSMLDRGVVYALAHPRGGGEMGRAWYDQGKLLDKHHTFDDFVDCGRWLVEQGWVSSDRLAAEGGSAGGLLIGASINQAPELFRAVHAAVPFVDALTTILDPTLPLTVGEWEEWGNPIDDPQVYAAMKAYSPYENIAAVQYPAVLATTSVNDTRVSFVEPVKWVQQLRETVTNDPAARPIVLRTEIVAGHAGSSGRYDAWKQDAFEIAFLLDQIGVAVRPSAPPRP